MFDLLENKLAIASAVLMVGAFGASGYIADAINTSEHSEVHAPAAYSASGAGTTHYNTSAAAPTSQSSSTGTAVTPPAPTVAPTTAPTLRVRGGEGGERYESDY